MNEEHTSIAPSTELAENERDARAEELQSTFSYDGYQVVRKELFAHLRDPAIVIRKDSITFNTACITGLEDVVYVHVMDVNDIIREMTDDTQLLILLNPNNPMGNVYSDDEFESIMKVARQKQITVLVDEAYHYFYPKTFIKYALTEDHVFITRTFSKLFSMAGCRLGYVVGWSDGVKMVQKMCTPHNTNAFAMMFAEKVLTTPGMLDSLITNFNGGRKYLVNSLDKNGYRHKGEAGNFIFIEPKTDAQTIVDRMKAEKKILIKAYPNVGEFGNCLRVSIGEEKYMKQFVEALLEIDR